MKKIIYVILVLIFAVNIKAQIPAGDTYMQGFYWNSLPGGVWWDSLYKLSGLLKSAGFDALWIPSANKGAGGAYSMGYDIYDHYDFGEFYSKGSVPTRFGTRAQLERMRDQFHSLGMKLYYDAVLNHTAGGELKSKNDCRTDSAYLIFNYPNGSKRFPKNANSFNPSQNNGCNQSAPYNNNAFTFAEDNCTDCPDVRDSLIAWGKYLSNTLQMDGVRLDAVKHVNHGFIANWINQSFPGKYSVAEYWGSADEIKNYYNLVAGAGGGQLSMFDFPLRYTLESMCNNTSGTFDMRNLDWAGLIRGKGMSGFNVSTFVENHDVDRTGYNGVVDTSVAGHFPIITDKHLAYGYILFSEGRPCVFFRDYFVYNLKPVIDTLIYIRHKFLGGNTSVRGDLNPWYIREDGNQDQNANAADVYVARRNGWGSQPGGYIVINDNASKWIDVWVDTESPIGTVYKDYMGKDVNKVVVGPEPGKTKNRIKLWAPKRSFTIYIADTTGTINQAPVILKVADLYTHTNQKLVYQVEAYDANSDSLTFTLQNNPAWLKISSKGLISGQPSFSDSGKYSNIIITVSDNKGATDNDTVSISVFPNFSPVIIDMQDTTAIATQRFERRYSAIDSPKDTLHYGFVQKPSWLSVDEFSGIVAGTPALEDTGKSLVILFVHDNKGGADTTSFNLSVQPKKDSVIYTYSKPVIDGVITLGDTDWRAVWRRVNDPRDDSRWTALNEFYDLYMTWDADSLYIGADYTLVTNTFMIFLDMDLPGGVTDFNSNSGYNGSFNRNFRFRNQDGIDLMVAAWDKEKPRVYLIKDSNSVEISDLVNRQGTTQPEIAIAWNTIYKSGPGLVKPNAKVKSVALIAGGENWGSGDAGPSQCDIELCPPGFDTLYQGPDSLLILDTLYIDKDGNGIPDPTIIITSAEKSYEEVIISRNYNLEQNYPNPFNPTTRIRYYVKSSNKDINPEKVKTTLKVYDIMGREVATLVDDYLAEGVYTVNFDASAYSLSSGIYFLKLNATGNPETRKMVLIK